MIVNIKSKIKCTRRCLTAFESEHIANDHIKRCTKQKLSNISFCWKNYLTFEDNHTKIPVQIRVYAEFERLNQPQPKVLFKLITSNCVYVLHIITMWKSISLSYFGLGCVKWFGEEIIKSEKIADIYIKTKMYQHK